MKKYYGLFDARQADKAWEQYLNDYRIDRQQLISRITQTDSEIDDKVFDPYVFTGEERNLVMGT